MPPLPASLDNFERLICHAPDPVADEEALLELADPSDAAAKRLGEILRTKDEWAVLPLRELLPGLSLVDDPHFSARLSVRAANAILRARVGSLRDLAAMTPKAIFELPQIGGKVADEILAVVVGLWAMAYADSGKDRPRLSTRMAAAQPIQAPVRLDDLTDALVRIEESAGFEAFRRRQLNPGAQPTQAKVALELEIPPERVAHYERVIREKLAKQVRNEQSPVPIAIAQLRSELGVLARRPDLEQALATIDPTRIAVPDDKPHRVELILQLAGYRISAEWVVDIEVEDIINTLVKGATERGAADLKILDRQLARLGVREELRLPWLVSQPGFLVADQRLVRTGS
jgi:Bacterial RNA polymerase, alpha chain C terminal domain